MLEGGDGRTPRWHADRERGSRGRREYRELQSGARSGQEWLRLQGRFSRAARELLSEDGEGPDLKKVLAGAPPGSRKLAEEDPAWPMVRGATQTTIKET